MIVEHPRIAAIDSAAPASNLRRLALWLCAAALLAAWLPRLPWGLWTDEAGTFWMAAHGWREAIPRTMGFPGQSILYSVIESFFVASGDWRELVLRIPSIAAMAVAAWQLRRIAILTIGPEACWIAVTALLCAPDAVLFGTTARPYAMALAASLASFRYLLEWRRKPAWLPVAKYLAASVLILHLHYLFGFVFAVQAVYLAFLQMRGERLPWTLPVASVIVLPVSLWPLLGSLNATAQSNYFSHAQPPELSQLLWICAPPVFLLGLGLGVILLFASGRKTTWRRPHVKLEYAVLMLTWLLLAPIAFFAVSRLTPRSLFAARYLLLTLPAVAWAVAWAISGFEKRESRAFALVAVFASCVLHPGIVVQNWRPLPSSWREPLQFIAAQSSSAPVFVTSGLARSSAANWREENPSTSWLYAALTAYPLPQRTIALPYEFDDHVRQHLSDLAVGDPEQFLIAPADGGLPQWMAEWMQSRGYRSEIHAINDYVVVRFHR